MVSGILRKGRAVILETAVSCWQPGWSGQSSGSVAATLFALLEGRGGQGGQTESRTIYLKFSQSQASGSGGARL